MSTEKRLAFICYRNADTGTTAEILYGELSKRLGSDRLFLAPETIDGGEEWPPAITTALNGARVMIVLIGPKWLTVRNEHGQRLIDRPSDWVAREIREALKRRIRVIPVLVDGADCPSEEALPSGIRKLGRLQCRRLRPGVSQELEPEDINELHHALEKYLESAIKGLLPYEASDWAIYELLQREDKLDECLKALRNPKMRVGVLLGGIGCGKTSFLQARLMKALERLQANSPTGIYVEFTRENPFSTLRQALNDRLRLPDNALVGQDLPSWFGAVAATYHSPIVLLLDQFDEFFLHSDGNVRAQFIEGLQRWHAHRFDLPITILFCVNSTDRLMWLFDQIDCHSPHWVSLGHFSKVQAVDALKALAEANDIEFDEPFVKEIVIRDLDPEGDGILPLELQIVAWAIDRQSKDNRGFTRAGYAEIGGVKGSLGDLLDEELKPLPETDRKTSLLILESLIDRETQQTYPLTVDKIFDKLHKEMSKDAIEQKLKRLADVRLVRNRDENGVRSYELAHKYLIKPVIEQYRTKFLDVALANLILDHHTQACHMEGRIRPLSLRDYGRITKVQRRNKIKWGQREEEKKKIIGESRRLVNRVRGACLFLLITIAVPSYQLIIENGEDKIKGFLEEALKNKQLTMETRTGVIAALNKYKSIDWEEEGEAIAKDYPDAKADLRRSKLSLLAADQKSWEHAKKFATKIENPELKAITFIHLAEGLKEGADNTRRDEYVGEALRAMENTLQNESLEQVHILYDLQRRIHTHPLVDKVEGTRDKQTQKALKLIEKRIKELVSPEEPLAGDQYLREQVRLYALAAEIASYGNKPLQTIEEMLVNAKAILRKIKHDQHKSIAFHILIQGMAKCVLAEQKRHDFSFYRTYLTELVQLLPKSTDPTRYTSLIESILGRIEVSAVILRATPPPSPDARMLASDFLDEAAKLVSSLPPEINIKEQNSKWNGAPPVSLLRREIRTLKLGYAELLSEGIMGNGETQKERPTAIVSKIQESVIDERPEKESLGPEPLDLVLTQLAVARAYAKVGKQEDVTNVLDKARWEAKKLDNPHQKSAILRAIVEIAVGVDTVTHANNASAPPGKALMELADQVRRDERLDASDQGWADAAYAIAHARQASKAGSTEVGFINRGLDGGLRMPSILWKWLGGCTSHTEFSESIEVAEQAAGPARNFALHGVARELARAQYLDCADEQLKRITDGNLKTSGYVAVGLGNSADGLVRPKTSVLAVSDQVKLPSQENVDSMQLVPGGYFIMGTADRDIDQKPPHYVYLDTFYIDKYEVTVGQYARFLSKYDRFQPHEWGEGNFVNEYRMKPVVTVTHEQAARYCEWAGKRLPTEAEWEKAARGTYFRLGRKDIFPWGSEQPNEGTHEPGMWRAHYRSHKNWEGYKDFKDVGDVAWDPDEAINRGNEKSGKNNPGNSPYEIYDMAGSVWEWVEDWYSASSYLYSSQENPNGPAAGTWKVLRGGAWDDGKEKLEATYRLYKDPPYFYYTIGFRCAK